MEQSTRIQKIKAALAALQGKNGRIAPADVVRAAKDKRSPLHREFNWNDKAAAAAHRLDRARELISRYVTVVVVSKDQKFTAPFYVRDPRAKSSEQGSVALTGPEMDRKLAESVMLAELDRCESAITRARNITGVLDASHPGLSVRLEGLLEAIVTIRADLKAA